MVRNLEEIGSLVTGGIFQTSDDFDFAVRRHNQDETKLLKLAERTATKIHHICLLQARENERVAKLNKRKEKQNRVKPESLCTGV